MIIDAHLHCTGRERSDDVLRSLDEAQIDVIAATLRRYGCDSQGVSPDNGC